jgi:arginase
LHNRLAVLGYDVADLGNIAVEQPEAIVNKPSSARFLPEIAASCNRLAKMVEQAAGAGKFPLVLGGDHSIAAGTIAGVARHYRKQKQRVGVIWIDAHADMNTPATSPSGNVHGMPLAATLGMGPRELTHIAGYAPKVMPRNTVLIGIRDVDDLESTNVRESGVHAFTMREVDELGMRTVMARAIEAASEGTAGIHLSFDMDSVDPDEAPGVGTPVRGGLTYREAHLAMEMLSDSGKLLSLEVVEVNPILDTANRTALLAVELIASAMGKRILP